MYFDFFIDVIVACSLFSILKYSNRTMQCKPRRRANSLGKEHSSIISERGAQVNTIAQNENSGTKYSKTSSAVATMTASHATVPTATSNTADVETALKMATPAALVASAQAAAATLKTEVQSTTPQIAVIGNKAHPVFLSYQSVFVARVTQLKRALEARGIPCWMATENMVGNVQDAIGEALMVAPAIIICYSHTYRDSMYSYTCAI